MRFQQNSGLKESKHICCRITYKPVVLGSEIFNLSRFLLHVRACASRLDPILCSIRQQVVFIDCANADLSVDRIERIKAMWYVMLTAVQDIETQRRGFCFIVTFKNAKLSQAREMSIGSQTKNEIIWSCTLAVVYFARARCNRGAGSTEEYVGMCVDVFRRHLDGKWGTRCSNHGLGARGDEVNTLRCLKRPTTPCAKIQLCRKSSRTQDVHEELWNCTVNSSLSDVVAADICPEDILVEWIHRGTSSTLQWLQLLATASTPSQ